MSNTIYPSYVDWSGFFICDPSEKIIISSLVIARHSYLNLASAVLRRYYITFFISLTLSKLKVDGVVCENTLLAAIMFGREAASQASL